jgi:hypothetical protein
MARRAVRAASLFVVMGLATGCFVFPDRVTRIANDIRDQDSPLIVHVLNSGDGDASGPSIEVVLVPGSTVEQGRAIACEVVLPAIERGDPPPNFVFFVTDIEGDKVLATDDVVCAEG